MLNINQNKHIVYDKANNSGSIKAKIDIFSVYIKNKIEHSVYEFTKNSVIIPNNIEENNPYLMDAINMILGKTIIMCYSVNYNSNNLNNLQDNDGFIKDGVYFLNNFDDPSLNNYNIEDTLFNTNSNKDNIECRLEKENSNKLGEFLTFRREKNNIEYSNSNSSTTNNTAKLIIITYDTETNYLTKQSFIPITKQLKKKKNLNLEIQNSNFINNSNNPSNSNLNIITIGRKNTNILLSNDKYISREHGYFKYINNIENSHSTSNFSLNTNIKNNNHPFYWKFDLNSYSHEHYSVKNNINNSFVSKLNYWVEVKKSKELDSSVKFINNGYLYLFDDI